MDMLSIILMLGTGLFLVVSLFALWVFFWGGDDTLAGATGANLWLEVFCLLLGACIFGLAWFRGPIEDLEADDVRLVVGMMWLCSAVLLGVVALFAVVLQV